MQRRRRAARGRRQVRSPAPGSTVQQEEAEAQNGEGANWTGQDNWNAISASMNAAIAARRRASGFRSANATEQRHDRRIDHAAEPKSRRAQDRRSTRASRRLASSSSATNGNRPKIASAFDEHRAVADLGARIAEDRADSSADMRRQIEARAMFARRRTAKGESRPAEHHESPSRRSRETPRASRARSLITPATDAPSRLPVMITISQRPSRDLPLP